MILKNLINSLLDFEGEIGEDAEVEITGAYGSTGLILSLSIDAKREVLQINSHIMSG